MKDAVGRRILKPVSGKAARGEELEPAVESIKPAATLFRPVATPAPPVPEIVPAAPEGRALVSGPTTFAGRATALPRRRPS